MNDLLEGLTSLEIYCNPAKDRKTYQAIVLSCLRKTSALEIRIYDVIEILGVAPDFEPLNRSLHNS